MMLFSQCKFLWKKHSNKVIAALYNYVKFKRDSITINVHFILLSFIIYIQTSKIYEICKRFSDTRNKMQS